MKAFDTARSGTGYPEVSNLWETERRNWWVQERLVDWGGGGQQVYGRGEVGGRVGMEGLPGFRGRE